MVISRQMHPLDGALHDLDRAGAARHDAGAQRGEIEAREVGMVELGDEHRRHAVKRGAALRFDGFERRRAGRSPRSDRPSPRHASGSRDCRSPCQSSDRAAPGCRRRSRSVNRIASAMKKPLLRMLWWVSVAPFGKPVVPLVNWMLIGIIELQLCRRALAMRCPFDIAARDQKSRRSAACRGRCRHRW